MKAAAPSRLASSGLWRRVKGIGLERFELLRETGGWTIRGTIIALGERGPAEARYTICCDAAWRTQTTDISLREASGARSLRVRADQGHWFENGQEKKDLAGSVDIDLGWSPSTNTIAIRRLDLPLGSLSGPLTMAWVRFPELTIEPSAQEYRRVDRLRYRYTSGNGFSALIDVDGEGLVVEYEGVWQRVVETHKD